MTALCGEEAGEWDEVGEGALWPDWGWYCAALCCGRGSITGPGTAWACWGELGGPAATGTTCTLRLCSTGPGGTEVGRKPGKSTTPDLGPAFAGEACAAGGDRG
mmetsp:Transcript_61355/g.171714  ORF Transcript_61355/g.171714 Transcript_61355/m.171714 type:complete len:104 (-) Transcript_61355:42-353(-)